MSIHELPILCAYKPSEKLGTENAVNFERVLHLELVNSNKDESLIGSNKHVYEFDDKRLHDEAAAEVMQAVANEKDVAERMQSKKKRKEMTSEEKSKQSRDRNREHARNTRLRKKIYVAKLKEFVDNLSEQKLSEMRQCCEMGARIYEMHNIRKENVRLFLNYRANSIQDRSLWASIIEDDSTFTFAQPYVMYRHFQSNPPCDVKKNSGAGSATSANNSVGSQSRSTAGNRSGSKASLATTHGRGRIAPFRKNSGQVIVEGIDGIIADCASLKLMAEGIGEGTPAWVEQLLRGKVGIVRYEIDLNSGMIASGDSVFCNFLMITDGFHTSLGCESACSVSGLSVHGTLDCKFSTENKIVSIEMMFDVAALIKQYDAMSTLCPPMRSPVAISLESIQLNSTKPSIVICKVPLGPALVVYVNQAYWLSIGINPSSSIAQMENWRGVSVTDFLSVLQHPFNLFNSSSKNCFRNPKNDTEDTSDNFLGESALYRPQVALPHNLQSEVLSSIDDCFMKSRCSSCSYCSVPPGNGNVLLNYIKFFPIMQNLDGRNSAVKSEPRGKQPVSHVHLVVKRYPLNAQDSITARASILSQQNLSGIPAESIEPNAAAILPPPSSSPFNNASEAARQSQPVLGRELSGVNGNCIDKSSTAIFNLNNGSKSISRESSGDYAHNSTSHQSWAFPHSDATNVNTVAFPNMFASAQQDRSVRQTNHCSGKGQSSEVISKHFGAAMW